MIIISIHPIQLLFSVPKKHLILNEKYPGQISLDYIKQWLNNTDSYSIQKQIRHRFKTAYVRVTYIGEQFDIDLMNVSNIAKFNDGIKYLYFCIDVLSKQLWVIPLKSKTAKEVLTATKQILKHIKPKKK